jgi:hypothetical protein
VSKRELPLPKELWDRIPPDIQAALQVLIEGYEQRIATLQAELAALKDRVNQNSQNSSRPSSSDGPGVKRRPPPEPSGRKRGGQPGHPPHPRALVPLKQVQVVVPYDHAGNHKRTFLMVYRHPQFNPWKHDVWVPQIATQAAIDYQRQRASSFQTHKVLYNQPLNPHRFSVAGLMLQGK